MIKLEWMDKPKRFKFDSSCMCDPSLVAIYCQNDTWDVHVFAVYKEGNTFTVLMHHFNKEEKSQTEFDEDLIYEAICDCVDDEVNYPNIRRAIRAIKQED